MWHVVLHYVCRIKYCPDNSCEAKSWAWSQWQIPRQRDVVFSGHCGVTSQSDGGGSALFTSLSRLTGPGDRKDSWLHFILQQMIKLPASNVYINKIKWHTVYYYYQKTCIWKYHSGWVQQIKWSTCNRRWHLAGRTQRETAMLEMRCYWGSYRWSHLQNKRTCSVFI